MPTHRNESKTLNVTLWIVQVVLAVLYVGTGIFKLVKPVADIAAMWPWAGERPGLLRFTGVIDLLGGIGIVVPALTRIRPGITVWAAAGLALLQIAAISFHFGRGEEANTPFNFVMLALAVFVSWGRKKVPVA